MELQKMSFFICVSSVSLLVYSVVGLNLDGKIIQNQTINFIKEKILDQLHLQEKDLSWIDENGKEDTKSSSSFQREFLKEQLNHLEQMDDSLRNNHLEALIPGKSVDADNPDMIFYFEFKQSLFKNGILSKAFFSFYKTSQVGEYEKDLYIAVAEIICGHVHVISTVKTSSLTTGWVQLDIYDHVRYWAQDFDDGLGEKRTLKLLCTNCKEKSWTKHGGSHVPYITIILN